LCPGCIFSKKVTCPGCIFLWRTWEIDISLWQVPKQTWWLCWEVKLIWDLTQPHELLCMLLFYLNKK
jgi:hypothetical protein